jgi:hypothetical protein
MPYAASVKQTIAKAPKTMGNQLGRWAIHLDFSVMRIAAATGATRQTIYNWMFGGQVTNAYRDRVKMLLEILRASATAEQAWRKACQQFHIKA